jgi:hypothetical protein
MSVKLSISDLVLTSVLDIRSWNYHLQIFSCPGKWCNSLWTISPYHASPQWYFCNPDRFPVSGTSLCMVCTHDQLTYTSFRAMPIGAGSCPVGDRYMAKSAVMIGFRSQFKANGYGRVPGVPGSVYDHVHHSHTRNQSSSYHHRASAWSQDNKLLFGENQRWHPIIASPWKVEEHINSYELRSLSTALRWVLSHPGTIGKRVTMISDSQVAVGCITKGRSSSHVLLRRLRNISAHVLAANITVYTRWVPSAMNPADEPSRRFTPRW